MPHAQGSGKGWPWTRKIGAGRVERQFRYGTRATVVTVIVLREWSESFILAPNKSRLSYARVRPLTFQFLLQDDSALNELGGCICAESVADVLYSKNETSKICSNLRDVG
jgi:hypothetical protein